MSSFMTNCTHLSIESDEVYVLLAVTTATLSFFLNLAQFVVILHQRLLTRHKNLIIINLCVCGQLSSATVIWYIYKVIAFWHEDRILDDYLLCFLLPSGLHLLTLFTFTPLITLLVLQHHSVFRPRRFRSNHVVISLLIVLAWCEAVIISLIPLTGWNEWHNICTFPLAWSPSFSVLICIIYFLHYPIILIVMADLCLGSGNKRTSSVSPYPMEVTLRMEEKPMDYRCVVLLLFLYIAGTMPFMCYTVSVSLWQQPDLCSALVINEKAAMWTSWITVVFAAIRPLIHVIMEEDLGDGTVTFITTVCRTQKHSYM